jgi:hypothetical protein
MMRAVRQPPARAPGMLLMSVLAVILLTLAVLREPSYAGLDAETRRWVLSRWTGCLTLAAHTADGVCNQPLSLALPSVVYH